MKTLRHFILWHRWLGIGTAVFFSAWFLTGIIMMYSRMPSWTDEEKLRALPELPAASAVISAADAIRRSGLGNNAEATLSSLGGRPVWQIQSGKGAHRVVFADNGEQPNSFSYEQASAFLRPLLRDNHAARLEGILSGPDQWTLGQSAFRPLYRVAINDKTGTEYYLSALTGEIVMQSDRKERLLAWIGAIPHLLFFSALRQHREVWRQVVIWLSGIGSLMCILGIVVGILRASPTRRYSMKERGPSWSPYPGAKRWHHWGGLIFGAVAFTFSLSGMLSLHPWRLSSGSYSAAAQRRAFTGKVPAARFNAVPETLVGRFRGIKQIETKMLGGEPYYLLIRSTTDSVLVNSAGRAIEGLSDAFLMNAARRAVPDGNVAYRALMTHYDGYYYNNRRNIRPLPVLHLRFDNPEKTWLYIDPRRGELLASYSAFGRAYRWIWPGLHDWDFPFLWFSRPAWDIIIIALCAGGSILSLTGAILGYRRLKAYRKRQAANGCSFDMHATS